MASRPHISIGDACGVIVAAPAPVLMVDTCTLLDVARAPLRAVSATLVPTMELVKLATQSPKGLHVVLTYTVEEEWDSHVGASVGEMRKHIMDLRESLTSLRTACAPLGIPQPAELEPAVDPLVERLHNLATHLYDSGLVLARDEACRSQ